MPMGIVSDEDFIKEKNNSSNEISNPINTGIVKTIEKGRGQNPNVPDSLRKVIGETVVNDGPSSAVELANNFGISRSAVSAYGVGANSTASYNKRPNESVINGAKERVQKRARVKLMKALSHITTEKLEGTKARDLAGIAKDMSAVIKNMEPEKTQTTENPNGPTFVFYAPQFKKEESYEVVYSKE